MRECYRCNRDLTDVMGVYVFVRDGLTFERIRDLLLCINCGNSRNVISRDEYEWVIWALQEHYQKELAERFANQDRTRAGAIDEIANLFP